MKMLLPVLACSMALLSACDRARDQDIAENQIERASDRFTNAGGEAIIALGMTERELLDANLINVDGTELGDVEDLVRGPTGQVEKLLIEVEDSNPDRYVHVPLDGLSPQRRGDDYDIVTNLTPAQIAALPEVSRRQPKAAGAGAR
jgi:sporulation protein YlmC with PRC-barrel domain